MIQNFRPLKTSEYLLGSILISFESTDSVLTVSLARSFRTFIP
jgi:hypothetical protein